MAGSFARRQSCTGCQIGEESKAARACFAEQGLEARCDIWTCYPKAIPAISFTAIPCRTVDGRGGAGTACAAAVRMLFRMGLQMMVADWEPSLLSS